MRPPSPAFIEAERVRRAAMRALRSGMRSRLTPAALSSIAGCERQAASNALQTLKANRLLEERDGGFALTEKGREGAPA